MTRDIGRAARPLPAFAIIGAQKSGTTSLYSYLTAAPGILPSREQEVHFFDMAYERGAGWYRGRFPTAAELWRAGRRAGYTAIAGETSPFYLLHPAAPRRMRAVLPEARLIVLLREPVDRAVSAHNHNSAFLGIEWASFEEAIAREFATWDKLDSMLQGSGTSLTKTDTVRLRQTAYLHRGHYAQQLERWFAEFPRDQFLIMGSGELSADPGGALARTCDFLGVPAHDLGHYPRRRAAQYDDIAPDLRACLAEHFAPHNERLFELLGTELDW